MRNGPETARSEVGYKTIGGKQIPYVRDVSPGDYVETTYGSQDATDHISFSSESAKPGGCADFRSRVQAERVALGLR